MNFKKILLNQGHVKIYFIVPVTVHCCYRACLVVVALHVILLFLKFQNESKQNIATQNKPAHLNTPVKFTSPERIKLTLQGHRLKCKTT